MATEYMESGTFCSGTCRRLLFASVEACPRSVTIPIGSFDQVSNYVGINYNYTYTYVSTYDATYDVVIYFDISMWQCKHCQLAELKATYYYSLLPTVYIAIYVTTYYCKNCKYDIHTTTRIIPKLDLVWFQWLFVNDILQFH